LSILLSFSFAGISSAQTKAIHGNSDEAVHNRDSINVSGQTDIRDVLTKELKLNIKPDSLKMKGDGPFFSVIPMVGYSLMSGIVGVISTSTSFYTGEERNRFSNILLNAFYSQYNQFWTIANSNIFIEKRKLHLFGDWRYYKFPTHTYGLGSNSSFSDQLDVQFSYIRFYQLLFREITENIFAGFGYNLDYHWNLKATPPSGMVFKEIQQLQNGNKSDSSGLDNSVSSGLSLNFQYDSRKNSVNPLNGTFASVQFRQNLTFLGSDKDWGSLLVDFREFIRLPSGSGNVLAFWGYTNFTLNGQPPYFDLPSTGWDSYNNTGRGYVPGRYTGRNFVYAESEYRIVLTRNGLIGGVAFCNAESVFQNFSDKTAKLLPGGGFGLRIKINKTSNANLAIDYGFGVEGSRGFFLNLGEVF
jgi:hypothetical protein